MAPKPPAPAAAAAAAGKPAVPRQQLVQLIAGMLAKRGPAMVAELERRIDAGEGLEIRGLKVDVSMLEEALEAYDATQTPPPSVPASSSSSSTAPAPDGPGSPGQEGRRWTPPGGGGGGGARWTPGAPSASLLAARALQECEHAEVFSRKVRVVGGDRVAVLARPDMLADPAGEHLDDGSIAEVVARYACQRDGRVYLRLREQAGWVSTRARRHLGKVVLAPLEGEAPLEPKHFEGPAESTALRILPPLDAESATAAAAAAQRAAARAAGGRVAGAGRGGAAGACSPPQSPLAAGAATPCEDDEEGEEELEGFEEDPEEELDGEEGPDEAPAAGGGGGHDQDEDVEDEGQVDSTQEGPEDGDGANPNKRERRFKVVLGRVPVLSAPCMEQLMATSHAKAFAHKQEFVADGAVFVPAEGRVYLRLRNNQGWVCERSRNDFRRAAVAPVTRRRHKLSKKMAKVVAFRGGDTDGVTRLRKEDLVKNRQGRIVSKKASEAARKRYADSSISRWSAAVKRARQEMGLAGFVAVKKGTPVYEKAREYYLAAGTASPEPKGSGADADGAV